MQNRRRVWLILGVMVCLVAGWWWNRLVETNQTSDRLRTQNDSLQGVLVALVERVGRVDTVYRTRIMRLTVERDTIRERVDSVITVLDTLCNSIIISTLRLGLATERAKSDSLLELANLRGDSLRVITEQLTDLAAKSVTLTSTAISSIPGRWSLGIGLGITHEGRTAAVLAVTYRLKLPKLPRLLRG